MQSQNPSRWQIVSASDKFYYEQLDPSSQFTEASTQHFRLHHSSSGLTANTMQLELSAKRKVPKNPTVSLSPNKTKAIVKVGNESFTMRALAGCHFKEGCFLARNNFTYLAMLQMKPTEPHHLPNPRTENRPELSTVATREQAPIIEFSRNNAVATIRLQNIALIFCAPDGHQFIPEKECFFDPATHKLSAPTRPN